MTLLSLLIIMAIERVSLKSERFHIATWCQRYFAFVKQTSWLPQNDSVTSTLIIAAIPAFLVWLMMSLLPFVLAFALMLFILWICIGCPVTRKSYKRYLQAANRQDLQACVRHSMEFGTQEGTLEEVGKQLVFVNYRQYAAVLVFYVVSGPLGLVFYSVVKELSSQEKPIEGSDGERSAADKVLFVLDWIPVRITSFGFLVVGHFSHALSPWLKLLSDTNTGTYDALGAVAKASEDVREADPVLKEPLQLVRLVKRNIIFLLMLTAVGTMVGFVS